MSTMTPPPANSPLADQLGKCPSTGYITIAGKTVGVVRCDLDAGHERDGRVDGWGDVAYEGDPPEAWQHLSGATSALVGTPHSVTLTWVDDEAIDWPEAHDPREVFDVDVPLDGLDTLPAYDPPVRQPTIVEHNIEADAALCKRCAHPALSHDVMGCQADHGRCSCPLNQGAAHNLPR